MPSILLFWCTNCVGNADSIYSEISSTVSMAVCLPWIIAGKFLKPWGLNSSGKRLDGTVATRNLKLAVNRQIEKF